MFPEFLQGEWPRDMFTPVVERLMTAIDQGQEAQCSGHDYRQSLEVAIALVLSAQRGGERVELPLADRTSGIIPRPYRLSGGDAVGVAEERIRGTTPGPRVSAAVGGTVAALPAAHPPGGAAANGGDGSRNPSLREVVEP